MKIFKGGRSGIKRLSHSLGPRPVRSSGWITSPLWVWQLFLRLELGTSNQTASTRCLPLSCDISRELCNDGYRPCRITVLKSRTVFQRIAIEHICQSSHRQRHASHCAFGFYLIGETSKPLPGYAYTSGIVRMFCYA